MEKFGMGAAGTESSWAFMLQVPSILMLYGGSRTERVVVCTAPSSSWRGAGCMLRSSICEFPLVHQESSRVTFMLVGYSNKDGGLTTSYLHLQYPPRRHGGVQYSPCDRESWRRKNFKLQIMKCDCTLIVMEGCV